MILRIGTDKLVKQGRAWGVYVVLASQKLPESCRDIYHQMLNRVALQSTEEVAKMILDADNPGIPMLANMDVGSGIFNDMVAIRTPTGFSE